MCTQSSVGAGEALSLISGAIEKHDNLHAVHLKSHGAAGELMLAGVSVDAEDLVVNASTIELWSDALANGGDFLIYGCDVAAGAQGVETEGELQKLAQNGCDEVQGYLISKPTNGDVITQCLLEELESGK